jgi:chemosensory pili system protein ChpA (sensor histidine kinase/response regulator)
MFKLAGYEVIQALRSRSQTQQTPIIVMTTRAGDKHRQMALNVGALPSPPVEERALIQELERWIGQESPARKA